MTFQDFSMMKMFLSGSAMGMIGVSFLVATGLQNRVATKLALGFGLLRGFGANILGGLLMGAGIYISGACPGTLLAQVGSGVPYALFTLLGGLAGAAAFILLRSAAKDTSFHQRQETGKVDEWLGIPLWKIAVVFSICMAVVVGTMEFLFPYTDTLKSHIIGDWKAPKWFLDPYAEAWSPIVAGVLMGLLQIPNVWLLGSNLAVSSSYVSIAGLGFCAGAGGEDCYAKHPYLRSFYGPGDWGQLASALGIVFGAWLSAAMSGVVVSYVDPEASAARSFVGGFLVLFGARLAGGCASGHGLSGIARLSAASLVVTVSMFAGAIGFGLFAQNMW